MSGNPVFYGRGPGCPLQSPSISAALPAWLAQYGYNFQLLKAGYNEIPVQVWLRLRAPPTPSRGMQVFLCSRPWPCMDITYFGGPRSGQRDTDRVRGPCRWPRRRGRAWAGPALVPAGRVGVAPTAGRSAPAGSAAAAQGQPGHLRLAGSGASRSTLDCVSGLVHRGRLRAGQRPRRRRSPRVDAPAMSCLSALPTSGVRLEMADELTLARAYTGQTYSYAPAVSVPADQRVPALAVRRRSADRGGQRAVVEASPRPSTAPARALRCRAHPRPGDGSGRCGGHRHSRCSPRRVPARSSSPTTGRSGATNAWSGLAHGRSRSASPRPVPGGLGATHGRGRHRTPVRPYGSLYARANDRPRRRRWGEPALAWTVSVAMVTTSTRASPYSELGDQPGGDRGRYTHRRVPAGPVRDRARGTDGDAASRWSPTAVPTVVAAARPTPTPPPTVTPTPPRPAWPAWRRSR